MFFLFPFAPLLSLSPFLSSLPPCIIPLIMCQCNFGVQDVSSLKRMCVFFLFFFLVPYLSTPPPLTVTAAHSSTAFFSLDLSLLSNYTIAASPTEHHSFVLTRVSFQIWRCQSHAFAISDMKTPDCSMHACFLHDSLGSVCRHVT